VCGNTLFPTATDDLSYFSSIFFIFLVFLQDFSAPFLGTFHNTVSKTARGNRITNSQALSTHTLLRPSVHKFIANLFIFLAKTLNKNKVVFFGGA